MKRAEELKSSLIDSIALAIKDQGLTQQRVAEMLGTTQGRVSNLVTGRIDLFSLDNLVNICGKLGMEVFVVIKDIPRNRSYTGKPIKQPIDYVRGSDE